MMRTGVERAGFGPALERDYSGPTLDTAQLVQREDVTVKTPENQTSDRSLQLCCATGQILIFFRHMQKSEMNRRLSSIHRSTSFTIQSSIWIIYNLVENEEQQFGEEL
ncbi:uncharacterized protein V6R79_008071 [Siganus canaliculatus]